jgi:DNA-binding NtrC family response regulator
VSPESPSPSARAPLRILVVDDNRSSADALARLLRKSGDTVSAEYDGGTAIQHLRRDPPDVVLTDLKMEPVDGMQVLAAARAMRPPIDTIVFTAYGAVDVAVRAMHLGARDFLTKPVTLEQVSLRLDEIRRERGPASEPAAVEPPAVVETEFVARSESSRALYQTLERVAGVPSPAWIEGELGAGRSFVAKTLHRLAERHAGRSIPLVTRPPDRIGEWPTEGFVLLPQVDDLHPETQRELHRDLQNAPDGVRILATARPEGRRRVAEGALRPELYYRLAVVVVPVPPLRRRTEDILPIFEGALADYCQRYGRPLPTISARVRDDLQRHTWPGNIRELVNLAERAAVMGEEGAAFDASEDAGPGMPKLENGFNLNDYLESVERRILAEALRKENGDRAAVGKILGVERNTLRYKLNKYGLLDR